MNIFAWLSLLTAVAAAYLGVSVYFTDKAGRINRLFLIAALLISGDAFVEFLIRQAGNSTEAQVWIRIDDSIWFLPLAVLFHIVLIYIKKSNPVVRLLAGLLAYGPAIAFALIYATIPSVASRPVLEGWGYSIEIPGNALVFWAETIWAAGVGILAFILSVLFGRGTKDRQIKSQSRWLSVGLLVPTLIGFLTEVMFPILGIKFPSLTLASFVVLLAVLNYAARFRGLFAENPALIAENIVSAMHDALIVLDLNGRLILINPATARLFGTGPETIGRAAREVFGEALAPDGLLGLIQREGLLIDREAELRDAAGRPIPVICSGSRLDKNKARTGGIVLVAKDIREIKAVETQLRQALGDKDMLMKELLHRVKNNMSIISSLLNLQAARLTDPQAVEAFQDSRRRILTMMRLQEKMYLTGEFSRIDLGEYLSGLAKGLFALSNVDRTRVALKTDCESCPIDIKRAVPCGLIVNELITNSLKYAFPEGRSGSIHINLRTETAPAVTEPGPVSGRFPAAYVLFISDDGIGLPPALDLSTTESMGFQLVRMLVSQLDGTLEMIRDKGTAYQIRF